MSLALTVDQDLGNISCLLIFLKPLAYMHTGTFTYTYLTGMLILGNQDMSFPFAFFTLSEFLYCYYGRVALTKSKLVHRKKAMSLFCLSSGKKCHSAEFHLKLK